MGWHDFDTGTDTYVLEGDWLRGNFDYVTDLMDKGIISDHIADDAVTSPALAANAVAPTVCSSRLLGAPGMRCPIKPLLR